MIFNLSPSESFCVVFLRPEKIPDKLSEVKITDHSSHLPLKDVYIGHGSAAPTTEFIGTVVKAYQSAGQLML